MRESYHPLDADVIVVGAGISGMTTAFTLLKMEPSLNVMILEATDRIGGRIASKPLLRKGKKFTLYDIGAQWISSQQKAVFHLVKELELDVVSCHKENTKMIVDYDGKKITQSKHNPFGFCSVTSKLELAMFVQKIEYLCNKVPDLDKNVASMSMERFIYKNLSSKINRAIMKWLILINCGVDPSELTVAFYVFFCTSTHGIVNQLSLDQDGLREFSLEEGAQDICNKIAVQLKNDIVILNNTHVQKIQINQHDVKIKSTAGTFYSTNVVMAIPPSAVTKIAFTPPLPYPKRQAFDNTVEGKLSTFVVTYDDDFWTQRECTGDVYVLNGHTSNRPLLCCFDISTEDSPALTGYCIRNGGNTKSAILQQLSQYFGDEALHPLKCTVKHWYGGSPMCCYKSFEDLCEAQRKTDRIFWAGAETSIEWFGTMSGAVLAANRAAREVIYDLRPALLSVDDMAVFASAVSNVTAVSKNNRTLNNIYKKLVSPYYQLSAVVVLLMLVVIWRKGNVHARLRNILIKT